LRQPPSTCHILKQKISNRPIDSSGLPGDALVYTGSEVQESAAPYLDAFLQDGRSEVLSAVNTLAKVQLPTEVTQKISMWIEGASSKFLWVEGPVYLAAERQLSLTAVRICDSALGARNPVPCVAFTPKSRYPSQGGPGHAPVPVVSRHEHVLIAMLYCIASQLIQLLPEQFSTTDVFEPLTFESLDGSPDSIPIVLDLIRSLLAHSPPTLIIIVDRVQLAESPATMAHLERFIALLRERASSQIIKALFISGGGSGALAKTMDYRTEKVDARRMVQAKPGQTLRGWSSLSNLNLPSQDE